MCITRLTVQHQILFLFLKHCEWNHTDYETEEFDYHLNRDKTGVQRAFLELELYFITFVPEVEDVGGRLPTRSFFRHGRRWQSAQLQAWWGEMVALWRRLLNQTMMSSCEIRLFTFAWTLDTASLNTGRHSSPHSATLETRIHGLLAGITPATRRQKKSFPNKTREE